MKRTLIYELKITVISLLSILLICTVETAVNNPLLYFSFLLFASFTIRRLWLSAKRDEKRLNKSRDRRVTHINSQQRSTSKAA